MHWPFNNILEIGTWFRDICTTIVVDSSYRGLKRGFSNTSAHYLPRSRLKRNWPQVPGTLQGLGLTPPPCILFLERSLALMPEWHGTIWCNPRAGIFLKQDKDQEMPLNFKVRYPFVLWLTPFPLFHLPHYSVFFRVNPNSRFFGWGELGVYRVFILEFACAPKKFTYFNSYELQSSLA
jgi:hypothetical protein